MTERRSAGETWAPFDDAGHHTIVRAQEVALMFGAASVEAVHLAFALAEGEDDVAQTLAGAFDRDAMRALLGAASREPSASMLFSEDVKSAIAAAFAAAQRRVPFVVDRAMLALGLLDAGAAPRLAPGVDREALRERIASLVPVG